ncbi:7949_t:CDS:2, partial [Racocetra persica]
MTITIRKPPSIKDDDTIMVVVLTNHVDQDTSSKSISIAEKIAARVDAGTKKKDSLSVSQTSTIIEPP